ncbi:ribosome maturation factor RimP [Marininema halotolerans]|uniref:Ribosome maturation factor RimP n=1 Tax=Marininema halotolerans TaxID=1155944 RepID=A0A1I6R4U9_9BACL|nr:ribosome maturation factor RimP [Marininema halotolerans]SFS59696.1 ribosome maturation factor RimP [Marininema halotolerans]
MSRKVVETVEALAVPILEKEGLELYDTEFTKEGKNWFLRVYIDRPQGKVDLDDCSRISERLSAELDEGNLISEGYFLEVSSPGIERSLKKEDHFTQAIGSRVLITTYKALDGKKSFEGELLEYSGGPDGKVILDIEGDSVEIPTDKIAKAKRVFVV